MSGAGSPGAAVVDASGLSLAIVATRWHREITDALVARGTAAALACGVPGSSECSARRLRSEAPNR